MVNSNAVLIAISWLFLTTTFAAERPRVLVIATGGTIAMKVDAAAGGPVPALGGEDLVKAVPQLKELATIEVVNFSNIPSDYMTPELWLGLAQLINRRVSEPDVAGVVVTHGTDTLEETAYFLDLSLRSDKPVVCIGAQRNASETDSDGPRNLLNAVRQILSPDSAGRGVTITMNEQIHAAREATKGDTSNVQTFNSGQAGALGIVDESGVIFFRNSVRRQTFPLPAELPRVDIVDMYAGADGRFLRYAVDSGAKAVVVAALGLGNVNEPMFDAIQYAQEKKVSVVISTRSANGRALPVYGFKGGGATLKQLGAMFSSDLRPRKARILVMLALSHASDRDRLQALLDR